MIKKRFISMLVLLAAVATGAVAQTTYKVSVKEGTEDATSWTIAPAEATTTGVAAGTTVTATYSGTKKVKSVKAVKMAYTLLSAATTSDYGKVVCAAGHLHLAKTAVPTGCTAVGILGKVTETGHGLILALQDATSQSWNTINGWTSVTTYAGTTLETAARQCRTRRPDELHHAGQHHRVELVRGAEERLRGDIHQSRLDDRRHGWHDLR